MRLGPPGGRRLRVRGAAVDARVPGASAALVRLRARPSDCSR
jgi:hypothetical protein